MFKQIASTNHLRNRLKYPVPNKNNENCRLQINAKTPSFWLQSQIKHESEVTVSIINFIDGS